MKLDGTESFNPLPSAAEHQAAQRAQRHSLEWLAALTGNGRYTLGPAPVLELLEACGSIFILEGSGSLAGLSPEERANLGGYLQSHQDPATGLFFASPGPTAGGPSGSTDEPGGLASPYLPAYLALQALDALGLRAQYPLRFMAGFEDPARLAAWLKDFSWDPPRQAGVLLESLLFFLIYRAEVEGQAAAVSRFHQVLDWLDQAQQESTGLWGPPTAASRPDGPPDALLTAGRLLQFYTYVQRPVQRLKRMIDTALDNCRLDGSASGDLARVDLLLAAGGRTSYRQEERREAILAGGQEARRRLAEGGQPGKIGASPVNAVEHCSTWTAWLRLLALAKAEIAYPDAAGFEQRWQFRRWPAAGYAAPGPAWSEQEHRVVLRWQRRLPGSGRRSSVDNPTPVLSVVIPCFNLGIYLYEALASVLDSSLQGVEILLVDDGSTDELTDLLLANLTHPRIQVIRQENRGLAAARNRGIEQAKGRYICCLDPDDRVRPAFFEQAVTILDGRPEVGLVSGYLQMFDEREDLLCYEACQFPELLVSNLVVEAAVFRRQAWQAAGGYYGGFSASGIEDWDLWISILELGYQAEVLPEVVWEYRIRAGQMSDGMYRPAVWQQLCRELALRHAETYRQYLPEVISGLNYHWADIRGWAEERERAIGWWQTQAHNWQELAGQREKHIQELEAWIRELEAGKARLEGRLTGLRQTAGQEATPGRQNVWRRFARRLGFSGGIQDEKR